MNALPFQLKWNWRKIRKMKIDNVELPVGLTRPDVN